MGSLEGWYNVLYHDCDWHFLKSVPWIWEHFPTGTHTERRIDFPIRFAQSQIFCSRTGILSDNVLHFV